MRDAIFYAKILLFGEYGITQSSKGLSIPYDCYNGLLKIPKNQDTESQYSNQSLSEFVEYLKHLDSNLSSVIQLNIEAIESDVARGMYFDSSIPLGYGVGSSGALVAAIYDKYAKDKIVLTNQTDTTSLNKLTKIFAIMESFFHGTSSGIDPLNSYLSLPILVGSQASPKTIRLPPSKTEKRDGTIFLLDSGKQGKTASMLRIFMNNMTLDPFQKMFKEEFVKYTECCIEDFLSGNIKSLFTNIKQLSRVVLRHFSPMIPNEFHRLWRQGIETNEYYLKLCGSGGGGYILGFTKNIDRTRQLLKNYKLEVVHHF